jgi:hypothetical protein
VHLSTDSFSRHNRFPASPENFPATLMQQAAGRIDGDALERADRSVESSLSRVSSLTIGVNVMITFLRFSPIFGKKLRFSTKSLL